MFLHPFKFVARVFSLPNRISARFETFVSHRRFRLVWRRNSANRHVSTHGRSVVKKEWSHDHTALCLPEPPPKLVTHTDRTGVRIDNFNSSICFLFMENVSVCVHSTFRVRVHLFISSRVVLWSGVEHTTYVCLCVSVLCACEEWICSLLLYRECTQRRDCMYTYKTYMHTIVRARCIF